MRDILFKKSPKPPHAPSWIGACVSNPALDFGSCPQAWPMRVARNPNRSCQTRTDIAAWVSGFFRCPSLLPGISDAPRVRIVQRQQSETALPWAAQRAPQLTTAGNEARRVSMIWPCLCLQLIAPREGQNFGMVSMQGVVVSLYRGMTRGNDVDVRIVRGYLLTCSGAAASRTWGRDALQKVRYSASTSSTV